MRSRLLLGAVAIGALFLTAADVPQAEDRLWEHRNLGKAFYENPDTHVQAVTELHEALQMNPNSVRDRINYGLALLRAGQTEPGMAELMKAQKQEPANPHTWFNLGIAYKHAGDYEKAIEQLQGMIKLVPTEAVAHYNLASVLRSKGDADAALPEFVEAERLNPNLAGPHFQLFSLYQRAQKRDEASKERAAFEEVKKRTEGAAVAEDMEWCFYVELDDPPMPRPTAASEPTKYDDKVVSSGWTLPGTQMLAIDSEGNGKPDLLVWSHDRVELLKHGTEAVKLADIKDVVSVAVGDYDNDGLPDLCVVTSKSVELFHNSKGTFARVADLAVNNGITKAVWLDFDHDGDLDLLLFGSNPVLLRNIGPGKFEEQTALFPFVKGAALDAAQIAVRIDTAARDLVVSYRDRPGVLYRDRLNGVFEAIDLPVLPAGADFLDVQDFNHDGLLDLVSFHPQMLALRNADGGQFVVDEKAKVPHGGVRADFNGDKREDIATFSPDGSLHLALNASQAEHWMTVRIQGVKNLKTAPGATVEMKTGAYYEKKVYSGVPLAFAVDGHADADTIRITWSNGLIQNEPHQKLEVLTIPEAQRLSGSCPMIFTWDGTQYRFITDVLGVAPLGASSGDGSYFPVDHDEYIQIPGTALKAENGKYKVNITEELHEVSYLDQVQLIAVDHPSATAIYTNDKFKSPPYPDFRLFGSEQKIHAERAVDSHGADVTERVSKIDQRYPDAFERDASGVAELHTLDLDFGKVAGNKAALILSGWVDWADGSTFLRAAQSGHGLVFPYLQVKDAAGQWKTVVEDMGIPSGKPKTMAVNLTGKFLSGSREVRIVTNLCVYWDEIFLINDAGAPQTKLTPLNATAADLHFRGFSRTVIDPERRQPEKFMYSDVRPVSNWNPTSGLYTRYGNVTPLLQTPDDRMVIMGSGDEMSIDYNATSLPAIPAGWTRDFLLKVDGWAKDADANTAFSDNVSPLPFHAMSSYPYKKSEHFPHADYVRDYLTRPALRLIRPLAPATE